MGRPKSFKREDIIQKSLEIFWLKGYSATSLSDLTEATGLNKKSLYNEFGSKQELFKIALLAYNDLKNHQVEILMKEPLGKSNVINYLKDLAESANERGCLLSLSIFESELLEDNEKLDVKNSFEALQGLIFTNLKTVYGKKRAQSLSLLMSSIMFSIAGLGKLKVEKSRVHSMIVELITLLEE